MSFTSRKDDKLISIIFSTIDDVISSNAATSETNYLNDDSKNDSINSTDLYDLVPCRNDLNVD